MENNPTPPQTNRYMICSADPEKHLKPIAKFTSKVFSGGQYVDEIAQTYIGNCHYDWDTTRLIWEGEELVHHWGVWGYQMRLDSVLLNVAGIGAVATDETCRKQGLMQRAALDSFRAMEKNGYDLTILRGRHYVKFGYVRAWNYVTYKLKPEEFPALEVKQPFQALNPAHIPQMDALYNRSHQGFTGTAIRPTYRNKNLEEMGVYGWFDTDGNLDGYVRATPAEDSPKTLMCLEAAGDPLQGLAVLGERFKSGEFEQLHFFTLPHHHPFLQTLRRGAVIVEDRYFDITGWRVRIVNLLSTLEKNLPQLEARLQNSRFAAWTGSLHLDAGEQQATLAFAAGRIRVTGETTGEHFLHAGPALARFLIGSDDAEEIIQQEGITCTEQTLELVKVLFPNLHPMMSHWDEY
jgi:predicted N-acetyltransferase YhbS